MRTAPRDLFSTTFTYRAELTSGAQRGRFIWSWEMVALVGTGLWDNAPINASLSLPTNAFDDRTEMPSTPKATRGPALNVKKREPDRLLYKQLESTEA